MTNEQLALRIKAGEDVADNMLQLYQQNMGIIKDYARKYRSMAEEEDLQQEAYFAICKAVDSYDPDKGVSFLSWAVYWIRQQLLRYCQNNGTYNKENEKCKVLCSCIQGYGQGTGFCKRIWCKKGIWLL